MDKSTKAVFKSLTHSQLLIWTGQELNPEAPLYNVIMRFDLQGPIDTSLFKKAFDILVGHSDAMRTVFQLIDGVPMQRVVEEFDESIELLDFSIDPDKDRNLNHWLEKQNKRHFDLSSCAFSSALIKLDAAHYVWYLNQHHIITDAWGVTVQYKALSNYYQGLLHNESDASNFNPLPRFSDFVNLQNLQQTEDNVGPMAAYWERKLKQTPAAVRLYGNSGQVHNPESKRIRITLGNERSKRLRTLAAEGEFKAWTEHLALYNIFCTLLFAYLQRVTGQLKLSIGTPAHNRSDNKLKQTPGVFIQFFPLMVSSKPGVTFKELHQIIKNETHDFMLNAMPGTTSTSVSRSFQVVLNYIHASFEDFNGVPMKSEWIHPGYSDPNHYMRLQIHDFDGTGNINLDFDLNTQVFHEDLRSLVPGHFTKLIDGLLEDVDQPIERPSLLSNEEFQRLVVESNQQPIDYISNSTVLDLFDLQVKESGSSPAISHGDEEMSYQTLDKKSNQFAHYLAKQGIGPGSRVAILMGRSIELVVAMWGVLKCGAAYVPLDPLSPQDRVNFVVDDLKAEAILTSEGNQYTGGSSVQQIDMIMSAKAVDSQSVEPPRLTVKPEQLAYIIYTSGTTGNPKGVMISHKALSHYILYAKSTYANNEQLNFPLFTTPAFDLTVTSIFTPLISGGTIVIYPETQNGPDLSILEVLEQNKVDVIKLTPSHISLLGKARRENSRVKKLIVGGEDFKAGLAREVINVFGEDIEIYNEYGPTETTVGCIVHKLEPQDLSLPSVPIGKPIPHMRAFLLDSNMNPVPQGCTGEIYLSGTGMADGYWNNKLETSKKFVPNCLLDDDFMYRTGDLARLNDRFQLEYQGRKDRQVKIGGIRIEPGEIEGVLSGHPAVDMVAVELQQRDNIISDHVKHCSKCGLPSNYPSSHFDSEDTCELCRSYEAYQLKVKNYFRHEQELKNIINQANKENPGKYHCLSLLSGGKDSTYALARLVEMGFNVLAFTLDNGYISDEAKSNIKRVVKALNVDHIFGRTEAMNAIFVDSLKRHCNVCNGCFKTIYTLSTNLAVEKGIPIIITGLSRGQFFETRLTEELFRDENVDFTGIDKTILEARKVYHQTDDAVNQLLDVTVFEDGKVFDKVQYVDFYRYCDVSLDEMMNYLDQQLPWVRPADTGRSTNCIINKVGIYEHKRRVGYSNYAFPYSWDVRVGHKTREETLDEINEPIDEHEVIKIMDEIGYDPNQISPETQYLVAYVTTSSSVSDQELRNYLAERLPEYMIPGHFVRMSEMPLTSNGKIDYSSLPKVTAEHVNDEVKFRAPETQIEEMLKELWLEVLQLPDVGVDDNFIHVGGNSLAAIRLTARVNEAFHLDLPLNKIFEFPTISGFGEFIEITIEKLLQDIS